MCADRDTGGDAVGCGAVERKEYTGGFRPLSQQSAGGDRTVLYQRRKGGSFQKPSQGYLESECQCETDISQ